jgi:macrolide transport system ATP-binding/permease protein
MTRLELRRVRRRYPGSLSTTDALVDVDLTIEQGEFLSIQGPSGSGKSTLLNMLGLLDAPTSGRYQIDGSDTAIESSSVRAQLRSTRFAFIFQSFHLLDHRPVLDSVELALLYRAVPPAERRAAALEALDRVGLLDRSAQLANTLSGGQRQRVAIARALTSGADVVVADEPTGNLDSDNSAAVMASLRQLNDGGRTLVVVTHSDEVANLARRRIRLLDGRIVADTRTLCVERQSRPSCVAPRAASRVRMSDLLRDAAGSLRSRLGRTIGLVTAVAIGIGLATATFGLTNSSSAQVRDTFNAHANRDVTIEWDGETDVDGQSDLPANLSEVRGVAAAVILEDRGKATVRATSTRPALEAPAYSYNGDFAAASRSEIRWASDRPHHLRAGEVLIGRNLDEQLQLAAMDRDPRVNVNGRVITIVGIIDKSPRQPLLLGGLLTAQADSSWLSATSASSALIFTASGAAQQVARQAPLVIAPYEPDELKVASPPDPTSLRAEIERDLQTTLIAFTALALLASIAGLGNAMVQSVLERRQEFGLRRAIGAQARHVAALVVAESSMIGALGGVIGLTVGLAVVLAVTLVRHWAPVFDFRIAPLSVLGGILIGALGGVAAAARASRVEPHQALQQ